jgi:TRAP-type C4-dicarboxylate transport system permease small subunit
MRRLLNHIYNASLVLAAFFIIGIFLLMIGESAFRKLGSYITGANELVGWFCAAAGFLALPATFKRGDMVRVGFIVDSMPAYLRKPILIGCLLVALVFVSYMVYAVTGYLWSGWRSEETSQGMIEIAVWIPQSSFLLGVTLLWVAIVDELVTTLGAPAESLRAERPVTIEDASKH